MSISPNDIHTIIGAVSALFGGVGLRVATNMYNHGKTKSDIATQIRSELRQEATELQDRVDKLSEDVDSWRNKYYDLLGQLYELKKEMAELNIINTDNKSQLDKFKADIDKQAPPVVT